jgi:heptose I phosphotransferase
MGFVKLNGGSITADEEFIEVLVALKLDTMSGAFECCEGYMRTHGRHDNLHLAGKAGNRYYDLFMKRHRGWEVSESIKLLMARSPFESAGRREWNNIIRLEEMGIPTMRPVAIGERKTGLFTTHSFIVTERVPNATQMDHYARERWNGPLTREELREKRSLLWDVGTLTRRLHGAGLTHMDLYLNHFFVREAPDGDKALHLIDLQRVGRRWLFRRRWIIKDLSAILYSARHLPLSRTDVARILTAYFGGSPDRRGRGLMKAAIARCERMMARLDGR